MIFSSDRLELRKLYFDSWHKYLTKQPLTDLETQITRIIEHHPENHHYLSSLDNIKTSPLKWVRPTHFYIWDYTWD